MPIDNPYRRPHQFTFPVEGVDVSSPLDRPKNRNKASRLKNLTIDSDGSLVIRPGLINKYAGGIIANKTPVHTLKRISDQSGASAILYGVQDRLANDIGGVLTNVDGTYSGNPLTIIPWRPTSAIKSYAYIYDSSRQRKLAVDSTTSHPIGIDPPFQPPTAELKDKFWGLIDPFSSAASWNNLDGAIITAAPLAVNKRQNAVAITRSVLDSGTSGWQCVQPASLSDIGPGERLDVTFAGPTVEDCLVAEVYRGSSATTIESISYETGSSGTAVIQPVVPSKEFVRNALVAINSGGGSQEWVRIIEVMTGYDGKDSFRCVLANSHAAAESLQVVSSFRTFASANIGTGGASVFTAYGLDIANNSVAGKGWFQRTGLALDLTRIPDQFHTHNTPFTDEDYFHISLKCADWSNIAMVRVLFDINGDTGATCTTKNAYYYAIEQSKLVASSKGDETPTDVQRSRLSDSNIRVPLDEAVRFRGEEGAGQNLNDRLARRDARDAAEVARDQKTSDLNDQKPPSGTTSGAPSAQGGTGDNQWAEVRWKRGEMFRIGSDLAKGWQNVTGIRIEITWKSATGTVVTLDSLTCYGGGAPDIGDLAFPYGYRYRYRDSTTGAVSDYSPSTRYGVLAYRNDVAVVVWGIDTNQADKIDIERDGGLQVGWCYVGTIDNPGPMTTATFNDKSSDISANRNAVLSNRRVVKPWARTQNPIASASANANIVGTVLKTSNGDALDTNLLPGTAIIIDGIATTLRRHIISGATDTLWELEDSLGTKTNVKWEIPNPVYGGQSLGRVFGPYAGCLLVCDGIYIRWTEGNDPDATHESNLLEVTDPSDVTVAGFVFNGRAGVLTTKRLLSIEGDPVNGFSATEVPFGKGAFTPYGLAIGPYIAWIARDGIYESQGGIPDSLTTEDLAPIFPLEGRPGADTNGLSSPKLATTEQQYLRLSYLDDGSLMFSYRDNSAVRHHLRYIRDKKRWLPYDYAKLIGPLYALEGDGVTGVIAGGADAPDAKVYTMDGSTDPTTDDGTGFACLIRPFQDDYEDPRSRKQAGDLIIDANPASHSTGLTVNLLTDNQTTSIALGTISGASRTQKIFDLSSGNGTRGLNFAPEILWTTEANKKQRLYLYELSVLSRPETVDLRATDYSVLGNDNDKYMQGVFIEADTFGLPKTVRFEFDGGQLGATITINHNGRRREMYSFPIPFIARLVRLATADATPWELYDLEYRFNPEPPAAKEWWIQFTGFDLPGYKHMPELRPAFASPSDVVMRLYADSDVSYYSRVITATGGSDYTKMRRPTIVLPAKKFKLWAANFISTTGFRFYLKDTEVLVKQWADEGDYSVMRPFGDQHRTEGARA
jgi:hypothetical protein